MVIAFSYTPRHKQTNTSLLSPFSFKLRHQT